MGLLRLRWPFVVIFVLALSGCGYGEVSPVTYEYAKSLYNVTNRRLDDHLNKIHTQILESKERGEISAKEAEWLLDIHAEAKKGNWETAMKSSRKLLEDQVQK